MLNKKLKTLILLLSLLSIISCLQTNKSSQNKALLKTIKVNSGNVILKIHREIPSQDVILPDQSAKNETVNLSKGKSYSFYLTENEVISMNILSSNGKDAEISVFGYGNEKKYPVNGKDRIGVFLAFRNRSDLDQ